MRKLLHISLWLTQWSERWMPSAFSIAAGLTLIVFSAGLLIGRTSLMDCVRLWGGSFWLFLEFSMQMCLMLVTGYLVACSPPIRRLLNFVTSLFQTPRSAIAGLAILSMSLGWINWALGIVGGAVLARLFASRITQLDLRLIVTVAYLGLGCTWHAGLSASAPLLIATPGHFLESEIGVIPVSNTIFHPFNVILTLVVLVALTGLVWQLARWTPLSSSETLAQRNQMELNDFTVESKRPRTPQASLATILDSGYWLNGTLGALGLTWFAITWMDGELNVTINSINFLLLFLGMTLHHNPQSLTLAAKEAVSFVHGIILQFPFYAGMFGIIKGTGLSEIIGNTFISMASPQTLPLLVYWYSGLVNYFVPSGGSKWAIEAPYLIAAAQGLGVPINKVVLAYAWGDMATNLLHPFWALPLLTATNLEFRQILGYGIVIFCFYVSLVSIAFAFFL